MKIRPIATMAVSAALLTGAVAGAGPLHLRSGGAAGAAGAGPSAAAGAGVRMGIVLKALDNPFFVAMYEGTRVEAGRRGVHATVRSVSSSTITELAPQATQVRRLVAERPDCYVVNPIAATNLVGALRGIRAPIVDVDSPIDPAVARRAGVRIGTLIGTDDVAAGRLAGARMAALLNGRGDVALVAGVADSVNSNARLAGFASALRGTGARVVTRVYADYDRTQAEIAAARILRTRPRLAAFFAANDEMALGIADALRAAGRTGMVKIIGVDGTPEALDAVRSGAISATVSQYPYVMGQMAVEACVAAARGARLPPRVVAPMALLTRDNVARAIRAFPRPVARYADPLRALLSP